MHFNKVVVIQSPVMIDINNSRSWRVKFYTDTGSSWTTVFPGGDELIILHGKKILWDKIGETAVKWISVAKIGEQWARTWVKSSFSCNSKLSFKVFLEICQNIPQDLGFFKKSLYFQSIYTREISPKSVLANACSGSLLSPIRQWSIRLIRSIGKRRNLCKNGLQSPMAEQ